MVPGLQEKTIISKMLKKGLYNLDALYLSCIS